MGTVFEASWEELQNAKAEIERLRAALKRIAEGNIEPWGYTRIAQDALESGNEQLAPKKKYEAGFDDQMAVEREAYLDKLKR